MKPGISPLPGIFLGLASVVEGAPYTVNAGSSNISYGNISLANPSATLSALPATLPVLVTTSVARSDATPIDATHLRDAHFPGSHGTVSEIPLTVQESHTASPAENLNTATPPVLPKLNVPPAFNQTLHFSNGTLSAFNRTLPAANGTVPVATSKPVDSAAEAAAAAAAVAAAEAKRSLIAKFLGALTEPIASDPSANKPSLYEHPSFQSYIPVMSFFLRFNKLVIAQEAKNLGPEPGPLDMSAPDMQEFLAYLHLFQEATNLGREATRSINHNVYKLLWAEKARNLMAADYGADYAAAANNQTAAGSMRPMNGTAVGYNGTVPAASQKSAAVVGFLHGQGGNKGAEGSGTASSSGGTAGPQIVSPSQPVSTLTVETQVTSTVETQVTSTVETQTTATIETQVTSTVVAQVTSTVETEITATVETEVTAIVETQTTLTVETQITSIVEAQTTRTFETQVTLTVEVQNTLPAAPAQTEYHTVFQDYSHSETHHHNEGPAEPAPAKDNNDNSRNNAWLPAAVLAPIGIGAGAAGIFEAVKQIGTAHTLKAMEAVPPVKGMFIQNMQSKFGVQPPFQGQSFTQYFDTAMQAKAAKAAQVPKAADALTDAGSDALSQADRALDSLTESSFDSFSDWYYEESPSLPGSSVLEAVPNADPRDLMKGIPPRSRAYGQELTAEAMKKWQDSLPRAPSDLWSARSRTDIIARQFNEPLVDNAIIYNLARKHNIRPPPALSDGFTDWLDDAMVDPRPITGFVGRALSRDINDYTRMQDINAAKPWADKIGHLARHGREMSSGYGGTPSDVFSDNGHFESAMEPGKGISTPVQRQTWADVLADHDSSLYSGPDTLSEMSSGTLSDWTTGLDGAADGAAAAGGSGSDSLHSSVNPDDAGHRAIWGADNFVGSILGRLVGGKAAGGGSGGGGNKTIGDFVHNHIVLEASYRVLARKHHDLEEMYADLEKYYDRIEGDRGILIKEHMEEKGDFDFFIEKAEELERYAEELEVQLMKARAAEQACNAIPFKFEPFQMAGGIIDGIVKDMFG